MASPSNKPKSVSAIRDFPNGCGTQSNKNHTSKNGGEVVAVTSEIRQEPIGVASRDSSVRESIDVIMKKAGFNNNNVGRGRFVSSYSKFRPSCGSKVKPLSSEESMRLIASQTRRRQLSDSSITIQRKLLLAKAVKNQTNSLQKSNATAVMRQNKITKALTPREKVLKVLHLFKLVFKELNRDKTGRHYEARAILMSEGMQVNAKKMIGPVPGIEIGDEFQYKSELNLIGLHFDIRGGIDYINRGDFKLVTSIISSEGNGYSDRFNSDVMIYSGQGGNLTSKNHRVIKDQKLETGNLALVHSMEAKTPVRVIRGKMRLGQNGNCYVYDGLYMVEEYWKEIGRRGNVLFKFKLCRVHGQPSVDLCYY